MRLRPLTEAECYARCYGSREPDRVGVVRVLGPNDPPSSLAGERLRILFEEKLDAREALAASEAEAA
jgi:hypothetical protein